LSEYATRRRKEKQPLSEEECASIMKGILQGIVYLHGEKDIIHRDLKPSNIVVGSYKDLSQVKLIDFGIATHNKKANLRKYGNIGTLIYQPPEQVMNKFNYGKVR
jgi:eukaryotic-like serine/threonine-protein kinase